MQVASEFVSMLDGYLDILVGDIDQTDWALLHRQKRILSVLAHCQTDHLTIDKTQDVTYV